MKSFGSLPDRPPSRGLHFKRPSSAIENLASNVRFPEQDDIDRHHHHHHHYSTDSLLSNLNLTKSLPTKSSNKILCRCCGHLITLGFSPDELVASQARAMDQNTKLKAKLLALKQEVDILQGQSAQLSVVLDKAQLQVLWQTMLRY